jgi:type II secretory pathway pseudopilin PulG
MKLRSNISFLCRRGFTLVEMMFAFWIAVMIFGVFAVLTIISSQNFLATANYVHMDEQSRNAVDLISREVRNASDLVSFSTNNPQYLLLTNASAGTTTTITCDTGVNAGTITLARTGLPTITILTNCDAFSFSLFNRYPLITSTNISFYSSTNLTGQVTNKFCKVINMSWKTSRTILGSKLNTEVVQTAQVVLRNKQ